MESGADEILPRRKDEDVAFLVVGDPFGATTHTDLVLRAKEKNIQVEQQCLLQLLFIRNIRIVLYFNVYGKDYLRILCF